MKRPQSTLFDRLAASGVLYEYPEESLDTLSSLVPSHGVTLDIGCGDGIIGAALDTDWTAGIEISPQCAQLALHRGLAAVVADATAPLPFADASFDTVCCIDVLHHLEGRWTGLINETKRILRNGGTLVVVEPDARNPFVRWTQAPGSPVRVAPYGNEPAMDPDQVLGHMQSLGFLCTLQSIDIAGRQTDRSVFPWWQRLLKAPFVLILAWAFRNQPTKFAIVAVRSARME